MSRHFDAATAGAGMSAPGMDPRQWCSRATVDPETEDQKSVEFTTAYGPLVNVTLRPSGIPVRCQVAHEVAGQGEGEWYPFVAGDEVQVLINEGAETAGCTIVGRLNQEIDVWPQKVCGLDATANTFGFRRMRAPYFIETASSYAIRSTTGAFVAIDTKGMVTLSNADNAFLTLSANLIGLQNGDADVLLQIDVDKKHIMLEAAGTQFVIDGKQSSLSTQGALAIGTMGSQASDHATTIEAVANFLAVVLAAAGAASGGLPPALLVFFAQFAAPTAGATLGALLEAAAAKPIDPALLAAIKLALSTPKSSGSVVGVGAAGLLIG
jgi:hypothetical protein